MFERRGERRSVVSCTPLGNERFVSCGMQHQLNSAAGDFTLEPDGGGDAAIHSGGGFLDPALSAQSKPRRDDGIVGVPDYFHSLPPGCMELQVRFSFLG